MRGAIRKEARMRYLTSALAVLRFGTGAYLLLTAMARALVPPQSSTIVSLYSMVGLAPVDHSLIRGMVTMLLAVLGLWLLIGRLLLVAGLLVMALGLINGISEVVVSQSQTGLIVAERIALLNLGLRDLLLLVPVGLSLAMLDAERRRIRSHPPAVSLSPEESNANRSIR
jgi:hypothetical protein